MKKSLLLPTLFFGILSLGTQAQNQAPVVTNLSANVDWQQKVMDIRYDVADAESDPLEITFKISSDSGKTFFYSTSVSTGDIGYPITPGNAKHIVWDYNDTLTDFSHFLILVEAWDRQPINIQDIVDQVDSNRLYSNVDFMEGIRHRTAGAAHLQATKDSIMSGFHMYNLFPWIQEFAFGGGYQGENIIGKIPGMVNESQTIVLDAHYDGVSAGPGADDNASGVAGVLEAARILSQYNFDKSIKFIGFDLEEAGLIGSHRYVNNGGILAGENISGVFNFEMIGYYSAKPNSQTFPAGFNMLFPTVYSQLQADSFRGNFIASIGNTNSSNLNSAFVTNAQLYVPQLKVVDLAVPGNGSIAPDFRRSDHAMFWDANYEALMLTDGSEYRNTNYHTPNDVKDSLNFTFMANVVKATIATAAALAGPRHSSFETVAVANIFSIAEKKWQCDLTIAPQHNDPGLILNFNECHPSLINVEIVNPKGKVVFNRKKVKAEKEVYINLKDTLSTGMYFINITTEEGKWLTRKVLLP